MEDHSTYFAGLLRSFGYKFFVFKNIWVAKPKKYFFTEEDLKGIHEETTKCMIAGLSSEYGDPAFLTSSKEGLSIPFQYEWTSPGTYKIPIEDLSKDCYRDMLNTMFIQMLMKMENGEDIKLCHRVILKKGMAINTLIDADLNSDGAGMSIGLN